MTPIKIFVVAALSMLLTMPAFAGNAADSQALAASLAQASSPENVKAVALQQKTMYCAQNAKNMQLQGAEKDQYMTSCLNKDDARLAFQSIGDQRILAGDVNEVLRKLPTAAGSNK